MFAVVHSMGVTVMKVLPVSIAIGAVFTLLSLFWACNPDRPWWRKRELVTDLCYWFIVPLFARYLRIGLLVLGAALLFGITTAEGLIAFYDDGHGPLAQLPLWLQAGIFLVGSDLMMYWIHRAFHRPPMWKYHAVHHSSEQLDWISAARFHPVNIMLGSVATDVVLLLAGISPNIFVFLGPFTIAHSAFVHANLNWTLGPFRYVIAGPVFHRWHHTAADRGGEKNFASTFPVLDLMFGTYYMPAATLPESYGVSDKTFPAGFGAQMIYPFRH
jgi:sterol desaturase/sphingolipid hydroxylase (fatty acid hydroxylase superfamily)